MKECAFLGGGGFAIELLDYMVADGKKPVGYYSPIMDDFFSGILPWLGDERIAFDESLEYIIASGAVNIRMKMIEFLKCKKLNIGSFISSKSYISSYAKIGVGAVIAPNSMVTGNPIIGNWLFLNAQSAVGHHALLGNNIVIGPGVHVTGHCEIGDNVSFGANSALIPETKIGSNSEIAICTFPKKNVKENKIVIGIPGSAVSR